MRRVDEAIRQVIGGAVAGELKDPRVGFVTVTDVKTSADLSHAHVFVSVLAETGLRTAGALPSGSADEQGRERTLAGLRSAHGYLQRRIAEELHLKRTPTLEFVYDDTTDRAMRLEQLLAETGMQAAGECHPASAEADHPAAAEGGGGEDD